MGKKEQETLAKQQRQEQEKLEKLKKEEEAKAKKHAEQEEKRRKEEQRKMDKQRKEEETRAKKEMDRMAKQQKLEEEKICKLKSEETKKEKEKSVKQTKAEPEALATSDQQDIHEDMTEQDLKPSYCNEDEPETVSELKPSESVIKRGVPKITKLAPPVVAIKMADLLTPSDDGPKAEISEDPSHNVTDLKHQKEMEKQGQVEKLKSEQEHQETLKREEEAIAKKEQERLAKLWQEQKRQEKIKKEEDAKVKKEKEREEKRQTAEKQKVDKQKREKEAKAKKEEIKKEKLKKQEHENLNKQEEQESKEQQCAEMKVKTELGKGIEENGGHADEQEEDTTCRDSTEHDEDIPDNIMECGSKPSKSVIIRGVPKNTKPSPAVVAIKMADLLALPEDKDDSNNDETTFAENENQPKDGQLKLDKLKKEKEAKETKRTGGEDQKARATKA